jgi:hypothetical protein
VVRPRTNIGKCKIQGCDREAVKAQMCEKHYYRTRKNGSPHKLTKNEQYQENEQCLVVGCTEKPDSLRLCHKHYHNYLYQKKTNGIESVDEYLVFKKENL